LAIIFGGWSVGVFKSCCTGFKRKEDFLAVRITLGGLLPPICIGRDLNIEHIMVLGGWESLDMVLRYNRSVRFEESLRLYQGMIM
jgi:hypothetical protein